MQSKLRRAVSSDGSLAVTSLQRDLEKKLIAYATASVSLLAITLPAEAEIVYTPANIPITEQNGVLTQLDLNNDGTPDFAFSNFSYRSSRFGTFFLKVSPDQAPNEIWGIDTKGQKKVTAAALPEGASVGSNGNFKSDPGGLFMALTIDGFSGTTVSGSWTNVETAFLGLKFVINSEVHYGWARVKFVSPGKFKTASISGYAYETTPNTPIVTGQTSGTAGDRTDRAHSDLGMLAAGASGLLALRGKTSSGE
jgi:hypothetical protein